MDNSEFYGIVRSIPNKFHSSHLRNFFSDAIENNFFKCFHFKHRPEIQTTTGSASENQKTKKNTTCAIFQTYTEDNCNDIIKKYNKTNWIDDNGDCLTQKCCVTKISINKTKHVDSSNSMFSTRQEIERQKRHAKSEEFNASDLANLSELRPPTHVMPQGNVGTPIATFLQLIKECSLPPKIIKKLKLSFPKTGSMRRYGNVPHNYETKEKLFVPTNSYTANGEAIKQSNTNKVKETTSNLDGKYEDSAFDDDGCEEWERHEALHSDVTSQERSKERLFEEEIELKWEKGGSGLVFYTDAQYWAEEDKDFDMEMADDWDVDMSVYYGEKGDMDAQDLITITNEKRLREGLPEITRTDRFNKKPPPKRTAAESRRMGEFEAHTKGIGRTLMTKYGWKDGSALGVNRNEDAIKEPVEADGQHPRERKGFGYRSEKLRKTSVYTPDYPSSKHSSHEPFASHSYNFPQFVQNTSSKVNEDLYNKKKRHKLIPGVDGVIITTKDDAPLDVDISDDIYRSQHGGSLKHRRSKVESDNKTDSNDLQEPSKAAVVYFGSKLVNYKKPAAVADFFLDFKKPRFSAPRTSTASFLPNISFVKGDSDK